MALPIYHPATVVSARFVASGSQLLTETKDGQNWLWDLPHEKRTVEELKTLSQLLSGQRASRASESVLQIEEVVWESWQHLQSNFTSTASKH